MNCKSLCISIVVMFALIWGTDFLIHGIWLSPTYKATQELWRPEAEMVKRMPYMLAGQAIIAAGFTTIFAAFVADKRSLSKTLLFAFCVALIVGGGNVIMYAVQPYPGSLVVKWFLAGMVQLIVLGIVVHFVYKGLC